MALLNEDGSLDVEKVRNLPFEEYIKEYNKLDEGQLNEYWSQIPLNESATLERSKEIDLYVANHGEDAMEFLNKMIEKYERK